jgi:MFS family permease
MGILAPSIAADLQLSPSEVGLVQSAFFIGYVIFAIIGGRAADLWGPKRVVIVSIVVWSIFCGLSGLGFGLISLFLLRLCFGVGEGPYLPTQNKIIGRWFPRREQATVLGVCGSGDQIGGLLAGPVVAFVALYLSWRYSFGLIGLIGLVIMVFWIVAFTDWPERHRGISDAEKELIVAHRSSESITPEASSSSLLAVCLSRGVLGTATAWFGYGYVIFFFMSWFPSYLSSKYELRIDDVGLLSMLPWLAGFVGRLGGGYLSDVLFRRLDNALLARKIVIGSGLTVAAAAVAGAGVVTSIAAAIALISVAVLAAAATANCYWALILDQVPQDKVGGAGGFGLACGGLAGVIAPAVTGVLIDTTGSYASAFAVTGTVSVFGALAVTLLIRSRTASTRSAERTEV